MRTPGALASALDFSKPNAAPALLLFLTMAAAPFPFGSVDAFAIAVWCATLGAAVLLLDARDLRGRRLALSLPLLLVVAAYAAVLWRQLPEPVALADGPNPVWAQASDLLNLPLPGSHSVVRRQPLFALGAPIAAALALTCGYVVCLDRDRAYQLLWATACSATFYAVIGIALFAVDSASILLRAKQSHLDSLTATFLNRNTAAVYFGAGIVVLALLICRALAHSGALSLDRPQRLPLILRQIPKRPLVMLLICLAALLLTRSRAGIVLTALGGSVAVMLYLRRRLTRRRLAGLAGVFLLAALAFMQGLGGGVSQRFNEYGLVDSARFDTYRAVLRLIGDNWAWGTGLGGFVWAYPPYRAESVSVIGVWNRAHNTLLELAAEGGAPFAGVVALAWAVALIALLGGALRRRRDVSIPIAGFCVTLMAALHAMVDFSMQIPGYAITACALCGCGLAQSFSAGAASRA